MAVRAFFDIATWNVKLPLGHGAVMTRHGIGSPIGTFVAISDSREQFPADWVMGECLRALNFCWPFWNHGEVVARITGAISDRGRKTAIPET